MAYVDVIEKRKHDLAARAHQLNSRIAQFPEGSLTCSNNRGYVQWYHCTKNNGRKYIPRSKEKLAEQLALKNYLKSQLKDVLAELRIIDDFITKHNKLQACPGDNFYLKNKEFQRLLTNHLGNDDRIIREFLSQEYEKAPYQEDRTFETNSGLMVRSKSEGGIANALNYYRLPFLYEYPYYYSKNNFPLAIWLDFTIMNPFTYQKVGWTHMGMMDDPTYIKRNATHIADLTRFGFIPGDNLIVTFEGGAHRLTSAEIEETITRFFPGIESWRDLCL